MAEIKVRKGNEILRISDTDLKQYENAGYVRLPNSSKAKSDKIELKDEKQPEKKNGKEAENKLKDLQG